MVQKEIKNKTKLYGSIAILSAILLVSAIYTITSPTVLYTLTGVSPLKTFSSADELKDFLITNTQGESSGVYAGGPLDVQRSNGIESFTSGAKAPTASGPLGVTSQSADSDYSTTNIQVAGVDEADTVKNDGNYIYTLVQAYSIESQNTINIVKADDASSSVVGKIVLGNGTNCAGMYLSQDGNRLVVLGSNYGGVLHATRGISIDIAYPFYSYYQQDVKTFICVYDVTNKANAVLVRNLTLTGSYFSSRMIGDYVYAVVSEPAYANDETVILPAVYDNSKTSREIAPTSIYYNTMQDSYFTYTTFAGINIFDDSQAPTDLTIMMGGTSDMYVSTENIYVTFPDYNGESTQIYRVKINDASLSFDAEGAVPGYILNQYSMDEYNSYFRVATTLSTGSWIDRNQQNNLYVLNMAMDIVGKVENLAPGEQIFSARFVGDKGYLVTFEQTDPFFVLDLSNPTAPKVTGELKIPGYSSYLHPYNENYIIGLGVENNTVKLCLFDVSDMNNPTEVAKYVIGEEADYAHSDALYDPKAFLFDYEKQLLVIPVSITTSTYSPIEPTVPRLDNESRSIEEKVVDSDSEIGSYSYSYWQGAYVFNVSPTSGFTIKGSVTQQDSTSNVGYYYGYGYQDYSIRRSLYIDNTLYTISNNRVQLNNLDNLALVAKVNLSA